MSLQNEIKILNIESLTTHGQENRLLQSKIAIIHLQDKTLIINLEKLIKTKLEKTLLINVGRLNFRLPASSSCFDDYIAIKETKQR